MVYTLHKSDRVGRYLDYSPRAYFVYVIFKGEDKFLEFEEDTPENEAKNVLHSLNCSIIHANYWLNDFAKIIFDTAKSDANFWLYATSVLMDLQDGLLSVET